jgi:hypothetical protein
VQVIREVEKLSTYPLIQYLLNTIMKKMKLVNTKIKPDTRKNVVQPLANV